MEVMKLNGIFCGIINSLGFGIFTLETLVQADILEQLILELEHSIRTTGRYPGR